ncbi:hypothetical protein Tco_0447370, partial [Tanacetum coccineum]
NALGYSTFRCDPDLGVLQPPPQMMRGPLHDGGGPPRMLGPPPVRARLGMPPPSVFCRLYNSKVVRSFLHFVML